MCGLTGCQSKQQKNLETQQASLTQQQIQTSQYGLTNLQNTLPSVLDFFQSLVSGGPKAMNALQPAISSLTSQYENAAVAENEFAPRGGGRTAALENAPYDEASKVGTLVASEQVAGAEGLSNIDQFLGNLTTGSSSSASSSNIYQQEILQQQQQQQQQSASSLGAGVGGLIALLAGA